MKSALSFFVFLIILGSASAEIISITTSDNGQKTVNNYPNVDVDNEAAIIKQVTVRTEAGAISAPQSFTPATDSQLTSRNVKGAVTFRREQASGTNPFAPPISEFYFLPAAIILSQPESTPNSPTGAVVLYETEKQDNSGIAITVILFLCITSLILITRGAASNKTRIVFVVVVMFIIAFTTMKIPQQGEPTGYTIQEFEPQPAAPTAALQTNIENAFTLTWTGGGPITFLPSEAKECSDGIDNTDLEDSLIDCADPGCWAIPGDQSSCNPADDLEQDMLEYDHTPVIDNQIDVYDIVNWIQYFNGDFSVLIDCTSITCTNQVGTANCVGDVDPNFDTLLTATDITFLQTTELANTDSRTVPGGGPICFNPV